MTTELEEKATALAVVEPASQLITIEPTEYVKQVFEPFVKRLADAKKLALSTTYDVKTTAGMATAVKIRATFRDIRVESEKARKIRKAPILEIGKLLDGRQKEIETEIEPLESAPDLLIKAEEKRKDDEKIAKALAESQRVTAIRQKIEAIKDCVLSAMGRSSGEIESAIIELESTQITLEDWAEYTGEAQATQMATVEKLKAMLDAQIQIEIEQQRMQQEREQLARDRADAEERERVAAAEREAQAKKDAAARAEQEARDRKERQRIAAEQQAAADEAAAVLLAERVAHDALMEAQLEELNRKQAVIDAAIAEQERIAREALEAAEAEERRQQEVVEAAERAEAERAQAAKDAAEAAELAARLAAEAEAERRERVQFEKNGPGDVAIVKLLASQYDVTVGDVMQWMKKFDYAAADEQLAAENVAAN